MPNLMSVALINAEIFAFIQTKDAIMHCFFYFLLHKKYKKEIPSFGWSLKGIKYNSDEKNRIFLI